MSFTVTQRSFKVESGWGRLPQCAESTCIFRRNKKTPRLINTKRRGRIFGLKHLPRVCNWRGGQSLSFRDVSRPVWWITASIRPDCRRESLFVDLSNPQLPLPSYVHRLTVFGRLFCHRKKGQEEPWHNAKLILRYKFPPLIILV